MGLGAAHTRASSSEVTGRTVPCRGREGNRQSLGDDRSESPRLSVGMREVAASARLVHDTHHPSLARMMFVRVMDFAPTTIGPPRRRRVVDREPEDTRAAGDTARRLGVGAACSGLHTSKALNARPPVS
ncbi:hypothetical protein GCM10023084_67880 [Streptomyces lacrimifluminis]